MRKDITRSHRAERMPLRRSSFFAPWFDEFFEPSRWLDDLFSSQPAMNIAESPEDYTVTVDLPGVKKEDINIETSNNQLTISAERRSENGGKKGQSEKFFGRYKRTFSLPAGTPAEKIEATSNEGVLSIRIPKGEHAKGRRIEIKEGKTAGQKPAPEQRKGA